MYGFVFFLTAFGQCCALVDLINHLQAAKERQDFESSMKEAKDKEAAFSARVRKGCCKTLDSGKTRRHFPELKH